MDDLQSELRARGFAVRQSGDSATAERLACGLGRILQVSQVRLNEQLRTYLARREAVPAHTDHPTARLIAWRCNAQDARRGEMLLTDGSRIVDSLAPSVQEQLTRISLRCRDPEGITAQPIWDRERRTLFYAPWLASSAKSHPAVALLARHIEAAAPDHRIRLASGDVLFLDNRRMLHGRSALDAGSCRWLTRYWIA